MPNKARRDLIDESTVGAYHVFSRCVQRAFLLGTDPATGRDYSHRKTMLEERLEALSSVFAVECLETSILDNHFHLALRNRPDLVLEWSDQEAAERWLRLNRAELELRQPTAEEVAALVADAARMVEIRARLSSISWYMGYLKEPLARVFNQESGTTGHFWAARFGCVRLKSDESLLTCSVYIAMNQERAGMATSIETSEHTSMYARLQDRLSGDPARPCSGYLASVHVDGDGYAGAAAGRRPSDKGYLGLTLDEYLELLDSLIQRERAERSGDYSHQRVYPSILARLGISQGAWEESVRLTSRRFMRELDIAVKMRAEAQRTTGR